MKDKIPVLYCKLKKYERKTKKKSKDGSEQVSRRYMIPVRKDQIEGTKFQEVEDIVILSTEDFEYEQQKSKVKELSLEKLKNSLNDKDDEIKDLKDEIKQIKDNNVENNLLEDKLNKKFQLKLDDIVYEYKLEIERLNKIIEDLKRIEKDYNNVNDSNNVLQREINRLNALIELEKQTIKNKKYELELTEEKYDKLKKSHELLWNVVEEKDKQIKNLEKRGIVNNIFNKIKK